MVSRQTTGFPVLSSTFELDTSTGGNQFHFDPLFLESHCHFGEVDELEEDVGRSISCLEGVVDVEG